MLITYDTNMEGCLQTPWSALDQSTDGLEADVDSIQAMPGMFPIEYEPLMGRIPAEIHELPGTTLEETEENVSDMRVLVEISSTELRCPRPAKPPKPVKLSTKYSSKDSSKARKETKTSAGPSSNDIVIAVFGLTGAGKSSFISKLTGMDLQIGHGLQSCESPLMTLLV